MQACRTFPRDSNCRYDGHVAHFSIRLHSYHAPIALLAVPTMLCLWLALPAPTPPLQAPALVLDKNAVAAQLARDHNAAAHVKRGPWVDRLRELYLQNGRGELEPIVDAHAITQRLKEASDALEHAKRTHGNDVALYLRAAACEKLEAVLRGEVTGAEKDAWLGLFANLLDRHHATHKGIPIAPHFVIRTLYKARWNTLHGLSHAHEFSPIEGQAYFGWLALHADTLPLRQRLQAIPEYQAAGGKRVHEAAAALLFARGHFSEARVALQKAYEEAPSLRLKNYLLFARAQARAAH